MNKNKDTFLEILGVNDLEFDIEQKGTITKYSYTERGDMISYRLFFIEEKGFVRFRDTAEDFITKWNIDFKTLKELLKNGVIDINNKYKLYLNSNNYKYRNLLKNELIKNTADENLKYAIGAL